MGRRYVWVTHYRCSRCKHPLNSLVGPKADFSIGPPILQCPACGNEMVGPVGNRNEEVEHQLEKGGEGILRVLEGRYLLRALAFSGEAPSRSELFKQGMRRGMFLGALLFAAVYNAGYFLHWSLHIPYGLFFVSAAAGLLLALVWPYWRAHSPRVQQQIAKAIQKRKVWHVRRIEDLLRAVEASRRRMADPAYRLKLTRLGVPGRGPQDFTEPAAVSELVAKIQSRLAERKAIYGVEDAGPTAPAPGVAKAAGAAPTG